MQKEAKAFMAQKMASLEGDLRTKYDLKKAYATHQVPQVSGTPEGLRDQTFATINAQSQQQGIAVERQIDQDYQHQAIQLVDSYRFQAFRTGVVLEMKHKSEQSAFKDKVKQHAQAEMGYLQNSATKAMYAQFDQQEDKLIELPGYSAVNLGLKEKDKN
jgi:hypothetical protein